VVKTIIRSAENSLIATNAFTPFGNNGFDTAPVGVEILWSAAEQIVTDDGPACVSGHNVLAAV